MFRTDNFKGYTALLLTAFLWGTAFAFQKHATDYTDAFTFNFLRFLIAIPALSLLLFLPKSLFEPNEKANNKSVLYSTWCVGLIAGVFMFLGISFQQLGLAYTTIAKSGFLTTLYILIVPILGLFIKQACKSEVFIGVFITLFGVYFLSDVKTHNLQSNFNIGDIFTIIGAFAWAAQVFWLGRYSQYANFLKVSIVQVTVVSALSLVVVLMNQTLPTLEIIWQIRFDILYTGVVSAGIAFMLQIYGQRYVESTNAALIMSTEAVFGLIIGVLFLQEPFTLTSSLGCVLILAGVILAQLQGKVFKRKS